MVNQTSFKMAPKLIEIVKPVVSDHGGAFKRLLAENLAQRHRLLSIPTSAPRSIANVGGQRSYMFLGSLARLERALMRWTMDQLVGRFNFIPVTVPNIVHDHIIENCGFPTNSHRSQVYKISGTTERSLLDEIEATSAANLNQRPPCIAGTSEFSLAAIHIGDSIPFEELPKRYCAISRCYRAETSSTSSEWGLYRVHYFNKVEMFSFTMPDKSSEMHDEFLSIQKDLFGQLGLHFKILEMPEDDLGLSAKKKYDIEAWMAGRERYGEISSTSNCEDYQASRLNISYTKMVECDNQLRVDRGHVHTVNGTACSSVRTMIALCEQHQTETGTVRIPEVLQSYMGGTKMIPSDNDTRQLKEVDLYPEPNK